MTRPEWDGSTNRHQRNWITCENQLEHQSQPTLIDDVSFSESAAGVTRSYLRSWCVPDWIVSHPQGSDLKVNPQKVDHLFFSCFFISLLLCCCCRCCCSCCCCCRRRPGRRFVRSRASSIDPAVNYAVSNIGSGWHRLISFNCSTLGRNALVLVFQRP